jgi:hypothetical protein
MLGYYQITGQLEKAVDLYASLQSELKRKQSVVALDNPFNRVGVYDSQQLDLREARQ